MFGDIFIILIATQLVKFGRKKSKKTIKYFFTLIIISIFFLFFISELLISRFLLLGNLNSLYSGEVYIDTSHWLFTIFSIETATAISLIFYYLAQGYYGLSLSLTLPFEWTFGFGSSFAINNIFENYLGYNLIEGITYPERSQNVYNWDAFSQWHTIFPWLASDFTFFGAIILVSTLIYFFGKAWKESLINENILSIILFSKLAIFVFFIPANNQIFQSSNSTLSFFILLFFWKFYRHKF
ncbi:hypothetical protein LG275_12725 [Chryseomicrobium palamuruense]